MEAAMASGHMADDALGIDCDNLRPPPGRAAALLFLDTIEACEVTPMLSSLEYARPEVRLIRYPALMTVERLTCELGQGAIDTPRAGDEAARTRAWQTDRHA